MVSRRFHYTCPFDWHFWYCHAVDDHNNLRHSLPSIEDNWVTWRWETRVFTFLFAITEVNAFLCLRYFTFRKGELLGCPKLTTFWQRLAWQMINNHWIQAEQERAQEVGVSLVHQLLMAPPHEKKIRNRQWNCTAVARHQQYMCRHKWGKKIRTYCACMPGVWICYNCFPEHVRRAETEG